MCLRNSATREQQMFVMRLDRKVSDLVLNYLGEALDLFKQKQPPIFKARKIKADQFEDVLVSYKSVFTETARRTRATDAGTSRRRQSTFGNSAAGPSGPSRNAYSEAGDPFKRKNFTLFSFVKPVINPYLKVKNTNVDRKKSKQDFYVSVTNLETMKRFFVKFKFDFQCDSPFDPNIAVSPDADQVLDSIRQSEKAKTTDEFDAFKKPFEIFTKNEIFYKGRLACDLRHHCQPEVTASKKATRQRLQSHRDRSRRAVPRRCPQLRDHLPKLLRETKPNRDL